MGKKTLFSFCVAGLLVSSLSFQEVKAEEINKQEFSELLEQKTEKDTGDSVNLKEFSENVRAASLLQKRKLVPSGTMTRTSTTGDYLIEQEPNNDYYTADLLSYEKPSIGTLTMYDVDYYKITVPRDGMLMVGGASDPYVIELLYWVTEKDGLDSGKLIDLGYEYEDGVEVQAYQAKKGTYYVPVLDYDNVDGYNDNTSSDIYMIMSDFIDNVKPGIPTVNKVDSNDLVVTGKAEASATVTVKNGTSTWTAKATTAGTFSVPIAVQKIGTKLTVTAKDSAGNISSSTTVTVVDGVAPSKPVVNKVDNNDLVVTGKAEANSTVSVKSGTTTIKSVKATSAGTFSASIPVQKAGTKLSVTAKDSAGNVSTATTVTVVDVIAPSKPTINKVDSNDLKVTGKAEAGSTVTVKVGSTTLGSGIADSKGVYSVKIKAQKKGTTLTVTAKDKAGNTSLKATYIVVRH